MPNRRNLYFFYKQTEEMTKAIEPLRDFAKKHNFTLVSDYRDADIIASVGGDNAFLQAIRKTDFREDCLYVGINIDQLGFYTDFDIKDPNAMITAVEDEQLEVWRNAVIEVSIDGQKPFYCINECTIRSNVIKTLVMDVFIDDLHFETFRGDGLIISTPTGSTAYNKSVRGAIVDPKLPSLQVSELASLNNNTYRTLGTSFILGGERSLTIKIIQDGNDHPIMGVDNEALSIQHAEMITLRLAEKKIKTLKLKHNSFWQKVQRSFL
ncbi:NAD kinase [Anaerobacillus sp. MEB173]|uniref:NAD kinase n=1 Tax=Anaerobacillus sp. MEB173 TaxID=3383345 RepID=UPI003F8EBDE5